MEIVTVSISAIGLIFAAIAAWGAVTTVELTRQIQDEADRRRMLEAVLSIRYAARELAPYKEEDPAPGDFRVIPAHVLARFSDAQDELQRAFAMATSADFGDKGVLERLDEMLWPDASESPGQVIAAATYVLHRVMTRPPPVAKPSWKVRLLARLYGYRRPQ